MSSAERYVSTALKMSAIIPFPQVRRRRFIVKTAERLANASPQTAEKLLTATLNQQRKVLVRKGINDVLVERECRSLSAAIRAEVWNRVLIRTTCHE
jgi:hypothetical protein